MGIKIVSNNNLIKEKYEDIKFVEGNYMDVLLYVRDILHKGACLISHPLPASIRMVFSPVRSILLDDECCIDENSLNLIEDSIEKYKMTMKNRNIDFKNLSDYELVDLMLVETALEEYKLLSKQ